MKILNASSCKPTINDENQHHINSRLSVCNVCTSCKLQRFTSYYNVYTMFRSNTNLKWNVSYLTSVHNLNKLLQLFCLLFLSFIFLSFYSPLPLQFNYQFAIFLPHIFIVIVHLLKFGVCRIK